MRNNAALKTPDDGMDQIIDLSGMTVEERLKRLEIVLLDIYARVAEAGMILLSLEADGYDTSKLRKRPIVQAVRDVAKGFLAREAFAAFYGSQRILNYFTALPKEEQIKLVEQKTVPVCEVIDGKTTHRLVEIDELTPEEAKLVFDPKNHKVRTVEEQSHLRWAQKLKTGSVSSHLSHDDATGLITAKGTFTAKQLKDYIRENGL